MHAYGVCPLPPAPRPRWAALSFVQACLLTFSFYKQTRLASRHPVSFVLLLALIGTEQERDDLCTGAAVSGAESGIRRTVGHTVLHSPRNSVTLCPRVQVLFMPKVPSVIPLVIPFSSAQAMKRIAFAAQLIVIMASGFILPEERTHGEIP